MNSNPSDLSFLLKFQKNFPTRSHLEGGTKVIVTASLDNPTWCKEGSLRLAKAKEKPSEVKTVDSENGEPKKPKRKSSKSPTERLVTEKDLKLQLPKIMSHHREWDIACKVYIGNLPQNSSKVKIEDAFGEYGPLRNVWVARNPPGFAFVEFENSRDAEYSVRGLDGTRICGQKVQVEMSSGRQKIVEGSGSGRGERLPKP